MSIKDAFEVLIEIFHDDRTQLVEDASDLHAIIGVRVATIASDYQQPILLFILATQLGNVALLVAYRQFVDSGITVPLLFCWWLILPLFFIPRKHSPVVLY